MRIAFNIATEKTNMKLDTKRLVLALLLVTIVSGVVGLLPEKASAVATVGVNVGDWAGYSIVTTGNFSITSGFFNLTFAKVTVTAISMPTNITSEVLETFTNGTQKTEVNFVDVDNGYGNGSGVFIGANLAAGDLIYPSDVSMDEWTGATINETITKNYLGSDATVNHYNRTAEFISPVLNASTSINYYWYKTTGMLTELSLHASFQNTTSYQWVTVHGVITSIVPEFPSFAIVPLFLVISSLAVVLARRKIRGKR